MYFLSEIEQKQLLPTTHKVGISEELQGYNQHQSPLKPQFDNIITHLSNRLKILPNKP